jgi:hypothetical protein
VTRTHHQAPVEAQLDTVIWHEIEGHVCEVADHDAEGRPDLPLHDQSSTELRGRTFCRASQDSQSVTLLQFL